MILFYFYLNILYYNFIYIFYLALKLSTLSFNFFNIIRLKYYATNYTCLKKAIYTFFLNPNLTFLLVLTWLTKVWKNMHSITIVYNNCRIITTKLVLLNFVNNIANKTH